VFLQETLRVGELLDPRDDSTWAQIADKISATIISECGLDSTISFWEALLEFFIKSIEPIWGSAHKGHIYFRLGVYFIRKDLEKARSYLVEARKEDFIFQRQKGGTEQEITASVQRSSAHVALVLLESIDDEEFHSADEKKEFANMFGSSFDAAIFGRRVRPEDVEDALNRISPEEIKPVIFSLYKELSTTAEKELRITTASLTGTVLEAILLGILLYQKRKRTLIVRGKEYDIRRVELGALFGEAKKLDVFPSTSVQATMQLVKIIRNRLHPGNELSQNYELTPRVSITLKIMFEQALIEWSKCITLNRNI
jgi:hypothetical protein